MQQSAQRGFGLSAATAPETILRAAREVQNEGFHSFWLNNPPQSDALPALAQVAGLTTLWLGVGVIPLSARPASEVILRVRQNALPLDRFYLGIGSGSAPVRQVAEGLEVIRGDLDAFVVLAALGPRMLDLAGEQADGVLLNWLTPAYAQQSVQRIRKAAQSIGRPAPRIMAYVRTALPDARERLEREAATYETIPAYRRHFERMGTGAMGTVICGTPAEIQEGLAAWSGVVDEVVARGVTAHDTAEEISQLVVATRPS